MNYEKYEAYKTMKQNLSKSLKTDFFYQAIFIEYAIIEDRCASCLRYAGVKWKDSKGRELKLSDKIRKMKGNPAFEVPYVRKRITIDLLDRIIDWKRERDRLIHSLASIPYNHENVRLVAMQGNEIVKELDSKVRSVNNYHKKQATDDNCGKQTAGV